MWSGKIGFTFDWLAFILFPAGFACLVVFPAGSSLTSSLRYLLLHSLPRLVIFSSLLASLASFFLLSIVLCTIWEQRTGQVSGASDLDSLRTPRQVFLLDSHRSPRLSPRIASLTSSIFSSWLALLISFLSGWFSSFRQFLLHASLIIFSCQLASGSSSFLSSLIPSFFFSSARLPFFYHHQFFLCFFSSFFSLSPPALLASSFPLLACIVLFTRLSSLTPSFLSRT